MSEEIWKDIKGYEGLYQVSNLGRVRSLDRLVKYTKQYKDKQVETTHMFKGRILGGGIKDGYRGVILTVDGVNKDYMVHRLVAQAFVYNDDPEHKIQVDHKDNDRSNNTAANLKWVTPRENQLHSIQLGTHVTQLPYKKKQVKDVDTGKIYSSMSEAEDEFGIPHGRISGAIRSGQRVYGHKFELVIRNQKSLF